VTEADVVLVVVGFRGLGLRNGTLTERWQIGLVYVTSKNFIRPFNKTPIKLGVSLANRGELKRLRIRIITYT